MNKFLSFLLLAFSAIAQVSAFMGTPLISCSQRHVSYKSRNTNYLITRCLLVVIVVVVVFSLCQFLEAEWIERTEINEVSPNMRLFAARQFPASRLQVATSQRSNGASSMEMRARVCDLLGKTPNRQARVVTFSHKRIKKVQHVNLQWKKFFSDELNRNVRLRLSTKGIKTVNKMGGIDAAAKKFQVDLTNF
jgi:large subunit ribosomal protein L28